MAQVTERSPNGVMGRTYSFSPKDEAVFAEGAGFVVAAQVYHPGPKAVQTYKPGIKAVEVKQ